MLRFKVKWLVPACRVMAAAMAGALLLLGLLATNGVFHEAVHRGGGATADSCVLCLLVKGQVDVPQSIGATAPVVRFIFDPAPRWESPVVLDFSYLASPSRAPPALPSSHPVVG